MLRYAYLPLLAAAFGAAAHAQQPDGDAITGPVVMALGPIPIHTAPDDPIGGAYGVWTAADSYKASFHGDMTFVPYLGEGYPHNQPLSWHTESVRAGGLELLPAGGHPKRWHSDYRYEYRFVTVTEAYDVRADGLEQSFVVHARPIAAGDLVVTGRIRTGLVAASQTGRHGALVFRDAQGREIVGYGAAFAFDDAGRRIEVPTSYEEGRMTLTVPGAWLSAATFPVTVDPLLSRRTVSAGNLHTSLDVARDDTADQLMVVNSRSASAGDRDAYARILSDDYTLYQLVYSDVNSSWSTPHIRVASSAGQKWCAVFERRFNTNQRAVRFHLRDSGDLAFSTSYTAITPGLGRHDWRPDVGGKLPGFLTTPEFAIVFQEENSGLTFQDTQNSRIVGLIVDPTGAVGPAFTIAVSALSDYDRPSINQQTSSGFRTAPSYWMVAYQGYANTGQVDDWDLFGRLVRSTGGVEPRTWLATQDTSQPHHRMAVEIAGSGGRYYAVYTRSSVASVPNRTTLPQGHEVYGQRIDWLPGGNPVNHPERLQFPSSGIRQFQLGGCAFDHVTRSHWAFTVHRVRSQGGSGAVSYRRVGFRGISVESGVVQSAVSPAQGQAGGVTFDSDNGLFPLVWSMTSSGQGNAYINKIDYPWAFPIHLYGLSCSSAQIEWTGSQYIGDEFTAVRLTGSAPNDLAILLVALSQANTTLAGLQMPGCNLLVPTSGPNYVGLAFTATNGSGNATFALPLPEFLQTDDLFFQWFHSAPGLNPANLATTRGLRVQVAR